MTILRDLSSVTAPHDSTLRELMAVIDNSGLQVVLVVNELGNLVGLASDGDLRRGLLSGYSLDDLALPLLTTSPVCCDESSLDHLPSIARTSGVRRVVIGCVGSPPVGLYLVEGDTVSKVELPPAMIMAGGKGVRLRPITLETPKPLIEVGGTPIIHKILASLQEAGFSKAFISINYLGQQVRDSVGDGTSFGLTITYVEENEPLGTAGAISLLPERDKNQGLLIMNGDLLVNMNFSELVKEHQRNNFDITVAARQHLTQVPYGVIRAKNGIVDEVVEKPNHSDLISAGIYCLSAAAVNSVNMSPLDMPTFINQMISKGLKIGAFPIHESWIDIGSPDDLQAARASLEGH